MKNRHALGLFRAVTRLLRLERATSLGVATSFPKLSALMALAEHGALDVESLASDEFVSGPSMVETIKPLIEAGWIEKGVDETDRRRVRLRITAEGRQKLRAEEERLAAILATLPARDRQALVRAAGVLEELIRRAALTGLK